MAAGLQLLVTSCELEVVRCLRLLILILILLLIPVVGSVARGGNLKPET